MVNDFQLVIIATDDLCRRAVVMKQHALCDLSSAFCDNS